MKVDTQSTNREATMRILVRVLFFGAAREAAGADEAQIELHTPATVASAFEVVMDTYPKLRERFHRSLLMAVNEAYVPSSSDVQEGDELAVFPPVSGGASATEAGPDEDKTTHGDFFELTTTPVDVGEVSRRNVPRECGATVTLDGYVREWTRGRRTLYLVYEAYASMALNEMKRLGELAHAQFEITSIGIVHRTGRLEVGETSVVISVSAPHRRAAFECCEWTIKELKRTVPIWKKEFYEDGEVWVKAEGKSEELL